MTPITNTPPPPTSATPKPDRPRVALAALSGDREFRKVRSHGQLIRHPLFTLRLTDYRPRYGEVWRPRAIMGIVVPKKTLKRAVDRNRARRRVREALRTLPGGALIPCRAILMPGTGVLKAPFTDLQAALAQALGRFDPAAARKGNAGKKGGGRGNAPQPARASGGGTPAPAQPGPAPRSGS